MAERIVDRLAAKGSLLDRLRARRQAVESGDLEGAPQAFVKGSWDDVKVDDATNNEKQTDHDPDQKPYLR